MNSIFLSASIPKPGRAYYGTADEHLLHAAIRSFLALIIGRRHLVWGGHPSITPMVRAACDGLGVEYANAVTLYQSEFFLGRLPNDNSAFSNVVLTDKGSDLKSSLITMRNSMFSSHKFEAAIFIAGMEGILEEHAMFTKFHPNATVLAVASPGGAARDLAKNLGEDIAVRSQPIDFTRMYIDKLKIFPSEQRAAFLS
jgi:hypothetical protein